MVEVIAKLQEAAREAQEAAARMDAGEAGEEEADEEDACPAQDEEDQAEASDAGAAEIAATTAPASRGITPVPHVLVVPYELRMLCHASISSVIVHRCCQGCLPTCLSKSARLHQHG